MNTNLFLSHKLSKIWQGGGFLLKSIDTKKHIDILRYGITNGLNTIDTAESYGNGNSEIIIGKAISCFNREDIFISSKVSSCNLKYKDVISSCENSLKRLNTNYIDLYHIHWNNPTVLLEETVQALKILQDSGKINYIGVSNFALNQILQINNLLEGNLSCIQMEYNLLNRQIEIDIIPYCQKNNIMLGVYTPTYVGNIILENTILYQIAKKYNKNIMQIILSWILYTDNIHAIIKSWNPIHIKENIDSMKIHLEIDEYDTISKYFKNAAVKVSVDKIYCEYIYGNELGILPAYKTISDAIENKLNFYPSPIELSKEIGNTKQLSKPIYITIKNDKITLIGGHIRYWAWVIAFGFDSEIECIVI